MLMAKVIWEFDPIEDRADIEKCLHGQRLISDRDDFRQFLRGIEKTGEISIDGKRTELSEDQYKVFSAISDAFFNCFENSYKVFE